MSNLFIVCIRDLDKKVNGIRKYMISAVDKSEAKRLFEQSSYSDGNLKTLYVDKVDNVFRIE